MIREVLRAAARAVVRGATSAYETFGDELELLVDREPPEDEIGEETVDGGAPHEVVRLGAEAKSMVREGRRVPRAREATEPAKPARGSLAQRVADSRARAGR